MLDTRCKEAIIIQIRDRPGFDYFLNRLESLGLHYSINSVDESLRDEALKFSVVDPALSTSYKGGSRGDQSASKKIVQFPVESLQKFSQYSTHNKSFEGGGDDNDRLLHSNNSSMSSILTTDPSVFVIVRIFR